MIFCLHTINRLQEFLFNTNYHIQHYSFIFTQWNSSKYRYVPLKIQLNFCHLFTLS